MAKNIKSMRLVLQVKKTKYQDLGLSVTVRIMIINLTDNKIMPWKEIKGSYLQDKIEEHIKKCINGLT